MSRGNIPGIHNYCDSWCERCAFTSRCSVFQQDSAASNEERDMRNEAFWDRLAKNLAKAHDMLEEAAKKSGVNLDELGSEFVEMEKAETEIRRSSREHVLAQLSYDYATITHNWLKSQPGMIDRLEKLKEELSMGTLEEHAVREKVSVIRESVAVIDWYSFLIHSKLLRALVSKAKFEQLDNDFEDHFNGTAKVALIAIDRSLQAWASLFSLLPDEEDHFLKVLSMLEKMKLGALTEFPNAMKFIRPGLDELDGWPQ